MYGTSNYQSFLDVDVLKVGHHGSKSSSSDKFLQYTSPQYALISVGIKNKFGHPTQNVISKFKSNNVKSVTVAIMEVPCCGGLMHAVEQAIEASGKKIPIIQETIGVNGDVQ